MSTKTLIGLVLGYIANLVLGVAFMLVQTPLTWSDIVTAASKEPFAVFMFLPITGGVLLIVLAFAMFLVVGAFCVLVVLGSIVVAVWKRKFPNNKEAKEEEEEEEEEEEDNG